MNTSPCLSAFRHGLVLLACGSIVFAQDLAVIQLPPPRTDGGLPLMQVLRNRKSGRDFSTSPLPREVLSDLLWAACGVNRSDSGHRTAPSAMNAQEIDIYVVLSNGVYLYNAPQNTLQPIAADDVRSKTGGQDFVRQAPVSLLFVADYGRMVKASPEQRAFYSALDTGYISQNVYLFCASAGLATVVHDLDRPPLAAALKLKPDQNIILAQAVGFPKQLPPNPRK